MKKMTPKNKIKHIIKLAIKKIRRKKFDVSVQRTKAWLVIFGVFIIALVPAIISLSQPAAPMNGDVVSEQALCGRRCASEDRLCSHQAGVYQPSIERCEIKFDVCRQACLPPQVPKPKAMTLRRCVDLLCKPPQNNCIESATNDSQRLSCETTNIECLSQCRLAIKTGTPLPASPLPEGSVVAPGENLDSKEKTILQSAQNQVVSFSYQLDPIKLAIKSLTLDGTNIPEELASAIEASDNLILEATSATSYEEFQELNAEERMSDIADKINKHRLTLERLVQLKTAYLTIKNKITLHERSLVDDKLMVEQSGYDLSREIADYDRLLDMARSSFVDAKKQITDGNSEKGLDVLITEVLDNLTEMSAIHQSMVWTLSPEKGLSEIANKIGYGKRLLGRLKASNRDMDTAEAFLVEIEEKMEEMNQATDILPFNERKFFVLSKELIDLDELYGAEISASQGVKDKTLLDYGLIVLPEVWVP